MGTEPIHPYRNPDLPLEDRVNDLISRFALEEKIKLMCQYQAEIPRLDVPPYKHGTEGAHGVAWLGEATVFPQNAGLGCTWNPDLMCEIGAAIGDEARVYYRRNPAVNGLTIWAPTVDMGRDPRWGRTEEAYGEDPHLTGRLSTELVKGMQGKDPFYYKTVATLKHFYGNNNERDRGSASVSIDPRNKREYYLKAFEPAFREGRAGSMMTAYNGINGVPCNLNPEVNGIVKGEWGMDGFVVSDAGDVLGTVSDHGYVQSHAEAVARSVKAGIDSITDDQDASMRALRDALEQGLLDEADLDRALANTFRVRFRTGEFDPEERNPYSRIPDSKLCAPEHAALSLTATRESIVLLKNDGLLPLSKDGAGSIALIGPLADEALTDWYSGTPPYRVTPFQGIAEKMGCKAVSCVNAQDRVVLRSAATGRYVGFAAGGEPKLVADRPDAGSAELFERGDWGWGSITLRAVSNRKYVTAGETGLAATAEEARGWFVKEVFGFELRPDGTAAMTTWEGKPVVADAEGDLVVREEGGDAGFYVEVVQDGIAEAAKAAGAADTAIVFVGSSPFINGKETIDRPDITLPPEQQELVKSVLAANAKTVVVIVSGYPFAVNWEEKHVPAILYVSHSPQELGHAVADVLFGDYNPGGRLNMTWYASTAQLPELMDYDIIKRRRTYQYFEGEALYPFGHGLSYTSFAYSDMRLSDASIASDGKVTVSVTVTNTGKLAGDEVVQLYVRAERSRVKRPLKTLKGFRRIHLAAGEAKTVRFELPASELAIWDVTRDRYCVESGEYALMIGRSSADIVRKASLRVAGETIPPRSLRGPVQAVNYDDYEGVVVDECREGGDSVRTSQDGGWIAYRDADLGAGTAVFEARVSGNLSGGMIEVRLDGPYGPLAGACPVPPTGGRQAWTTVTGPVEGMAGRRDVFLALRGDIGLSRFRLY